MNYDSLLSFDECTNFNALVESMIKRSCIIDYGIVLDSPADGIVNVAVAVSDTKQNQFCMTCVLANLASSSITTYVKPNEGDRVIVFYPRMYNPKMFTVPEDEEERTAVLVDESARGYNLACGIAVLMNQYKEDSHLNVLNIADGTVDLKLAYSADDEKNFFTLQVEDTGALHINSNDGKFTFDVDNADGDITTTLKCNDASININKDSEITITGKSSTTVVIDKDGNIKLTAGGKVSIKNSSANLFTILDGMLTILNNTLATAGSPASHTVVPSQFQQQQNQLGSLME